METHVCVFVTGCVADIVKSLFLLYFHLKSELWQRQYKKAIGYNSNNPIKM